MRFVVATLLAAASLSGLAGLVLANGQEPTNTNYPVVTQLELRDRTVTITLAPNGYLYSIADESGAILSANLTEEQLAEQYPELSNTLRPAVAEDGAELIMLTPIQIMD